MYLVHILHQGQINILWNISALTATKIFHFHVYWVGILPQKAKEYSIFICFNCTYYPKAKPILSDIFKHQQLSKYFIVTCINCVYYSEGKNNVLQNISALTPASLRLNAHVPQSINNIPWTISAPRATEIFHFHMDSVHMFPKPQTIFPGLFRCRELLKCYIFMCNKYTYYTEGKPIFHFHVYCICILLQRQNNIPWNISAPTVTKIFHFPMDWVHMFPKPQAIFPTVFQCQEPPKYYIVKCIKCRYYTTGKTIFSTIFRHHPLGRIMCPGVFQHQRWVFPADHDSGLILQYSPSDNIPGRPNHGPRRSENVLKRSNNVPGRSSNAPEMSDNVLRRSKNVPRRWHLFPEGQTWMFGPQELPKDVIFNCSECTYYSKDKPICSRDISAPTAAKIFYFHVY